MADFPNQSLWDAYFNQNPDVAYRRWLNTQPGLGFGYDPRSKFYESQYNRQYANYQAAAPQHAIDYSFTNYLQDNGGNLGQQFASLSPQQRGENPGLYSGRTRWVL